MIRAAIAVFGVLLAASVQAAPLDRATAGGRVVTIRSDPGGVIAQYAMKVRKIEREDAFIRFDGRCDSACTLYLRLAATRACVSTRSSFGFHLPHGVPGRQAALARDYMLNSYPDWVRRWISDNGGLTSRLKTMPYAYARQFVPDCDEITM